MRSIKIILISLLLLFSFQNKLFSEIRYVDFKYVLNESKAGKEAQVYLKKKLDNGVKSLKNKEKTIQDEERGNTGRVDWGAGSIGADGFCRPPTLLVSGQ